MDTKDKKEEFIFEIIHDIKAPILGMDFALRNIERSEFEEELYKVNKHNLEYINNMLNLYKTRSEEREKGLMPVNLANLIEDEIKALNFLIEEKSLKIRISKNIKGNTVIISNRQIIRQIILNILTNAVKYTPNNEEIKIKITENKKILAFEITNKPLKLTPKEGLTLGMNIIRKRTKEIGAKLNISKHENFVCFCVEFKK